MTGWDGQVSFGEEMETGLGGTKLGVLASRIELTSMAYFVCVMITLVVALEVLQRVVYYSKN